MARIVLCGYMVRHPLAGNVLAFFHYALGLHRLGHDVLYLEESGWPYSCYDPPSRHWTDFPAWGLGVVRDLFRSYGAGVPVVYLNRETGDVDGAGRGDVVEWLREADLLLNVGGVCNLPEFQLCRRRAIVDMDPLFTQVERFGAQTLADHHVHFSYGANIGRPGCGVPQRGVLWHATAPPVVLDLWNWAEPPPDAPFTTVANWGSYGGVTYEGEHYGQKDVEFARVMNLPRRVSRRMELAISGGHEIHARWRESGWTIRDAGEEVSRSVPDYMEYIRRSFAEFSVAKNAYVKSRCGWFSDRSACYLASGLPVVLQETGFRDWLHPDGGLLSFGDLDEAVRCVEEVVRDYPAHRRAARDLAERAFAHDVVLPRLVEKALALEVR